jgi:hypothetical protein
MPIITSANIPAAGSTLGLIYRSAPRGSETQYITQPYTIRKSTVRVKTPTRPTAALRLNNGPHPKPPKIRPDIQGIKTSPHWKSLLICGDVYVAKSMLILGIRTLLTFDVCRIHTLTTCKNKEAPAVARGRHAFSTDVRKVDPTQRCESCGCTHPHCKCRGVGCGLPRREPLRLQ